MPASRSPARRALALVALPLAAFALLAWRFDFLCDDAYISFRYARNFAEGHGLRYNLTASPPVEGYSNFLWVVWLAGLHRLGLEITLWARLSSSLCGALLVAWATLFARRRLALDGPAAAASGLFLATLPPVALWATGGLATTPVTLCVFGCYVRLLGDPARPRAGQAALFAALAALVRADGAAWIALLLASAGLVWLLERRPRALLRATLTVGATLAVVVAAHVAWRHSYYGELVPNTARIKAGFSGARLERGVEYLASFLLTLPAIALALASGLRRWPAGTRGVWLPSAVVLAGTFAYSVWVGGDFMPMGRFLMPALPFAALVLAGAWRAFPRPAAGALTALCVALSLLAAFDLGPVPESVRRKAQFRRDRPWETEVEMWAGMKRRAEEWSLMGRALARCARPGESIVLGPMGAVGYYSGLEVYDTYGLVTPSVAERGARLPNATPGHDVRVDPDFFLDRRPTYLGCLLLPADAEALASLEANRERIPYLAMVELERCPLPESEGFPPDAELVLLRFRRWE